MNNTSFLKLSQKFHCCQEQPKVVYVVNQKRNDEIRGLFLKMKENFTQIKITVESYEMKSLLGHVMSLSLHPFVPIKREKELERILLACTKPYNFHVADDSRVCYLLRREGFFVQGHLQKSIRWSVMFTS